jgi:hypothetical protein
VLNYGKLDKMNKKSKSGKMAKQRQRNEGVLFADINFRTRTSKDKKTSQEKVNSRAWIKFSLIAVVIFGGVFGFAYYAYISGYHQASDDFAPRIVADTSPIKELPEEPGGMEVPHQDKLVFDMLQKQEGDERRVEHLSPPSEQPIAKEELIQTADVSEEKFDDVTDFLAEKKPEEVVENLIEKAPTIEEKSEVAEVAPSDELDKLIEESKALLAENKVEETVEAKEAPEAEKVQEQPKSLLAALDKPKKIELQSLNTNGPKFRIQLASLRTNDAAKREITRLQKQYSGILKNCQLQIVSANLGDRGIYYRIRSNLIAEADARQMVKELSNRNQSCILVK